MDMLKHFLAKHGDKKFYSCPFCDDPGKRFCLGNNLRAHVEYVHPQPRVKRPLHYDWGPKEQRPRVCDCGRRVRDDDEEEESDNEYHESTSDTDLFDESDPDFEGAFDTKDVDLFDTEDDDLY
jgi:hypothetical protein